MDDSTAHAGFAALRSLNLGDILTMPDGRDLTVRAVQPRLSNPAAQMTGFVLAGEVGPQATLLSIPEHDGGDILLYAPYDRVPAAASDLRVVDEGVVSYLSPHMVDIAGAMGELAYRVCLARRLPDPLVLMWRGRELVVFARSAGISARSLRVCRMREDAERTERDVVRYSAAVRHEVDVPVGSSPDLVGAGGLYETFTRR